MTDQAKLAALIARAIVHLNFNEPERAETVLFHALTEINFSNFNDKKENSHGNRTAA